MAGRVAVLVFAVMVAGPLMGEWPEGSKQWSETRGIEAEVRSLESTEATPATSLGSEGNPQRGYELLTTKAFATPIWLRSSYDAAWKQWGAKKKPADYDLAFRERYGLHPAPYPNNGLPMGLREVNGLLGKGLTNDCMVCHGGSIFGKSYVGLGNASLELEALFIELAGMRADRGTLRPALFPFTNVRGTMEAGAMSVYLISIREPETLALRLNKPADLGLRADLCEDTPPWWHLKKKTRLYYNGSVDSRSVRTLMQFTLSPFHTLKDIQAMEPDFRDIQAYLRTIEPPKYPRNFDVELAAQGREVFENNCSSCHGTYGKNWTYPNKIISLKEIGTDPNRAQGISDRAKAHYDRTWFGAEIGPDGKRFVTTNARGYVAPPLDGIWATAPYLHNGSVPTLAHLLNSKSRPTRFARSYRTDEADYDFERVGWKVMAVDKKSSERDLVERRKVYDTTQPGRGNQGHTFGDDLTDEERRAVIEYLKSL